MWHTKWIWHWKLKQKWFFTCFSATLHVPDQIWAWRKFNNSNMNSAMWKCLLDCVYRTLLVGISNWSCQKNIDEKSIFLLCWTRKAWSSECWNDSIILLINRYPIPASSLVYQHRYDPGCCVYIVHCPNHTPYGEGGGITSNHHCSSSHPSQSYLSAAVLWRMKMLSRFKLLLHPSLLRPSPGYCLCPAPATTSKGSHFYIQEYFMKNR